MRVMKKLKIVMTALIAAQLMFVLYKVGAQASVADVSFGKTHFIVGVDSQTIAKTLPPERVADTCHADLATSLLICNDGSIKHALFSPDDDIAAMLCELITKEQQSIKAAIFSFTDVDIALALCEAKERGVQVELITDVSCTRDKFNKIDMIKAKGVPVCVYNPPPKAFSNDIMHNKFLVFGKNIQNKKLLWTGSYNWTKSAKLRNQENILILDEPHLVERYEKQFEIIKQRIEHPDTTIKIAKRATAKKSRKKKMETVSELQAIC